MQRVYKSLQSIFLSRCFLEDVIIPYYEIHDD
jgi:hypothetical protein